MKNMPIKICTWLLLLGAVGASAQQMPDIGFKSVGRGRPLAADVNKLEQVGPTWIRPPGPPQRDVGELPFYGFRPNALPKNYKPLPRDLFTSPDFYADKALWSDPRYFRCNSPAATEMQRAIIRPPALNPTSNIADGPWGYCNLDYPRKEIVSPYAFTSAQAHYEALLEETRKRGGPNVYTFKDFPSVEWNGVYQSPNQGRGNHLNWYWGEHSQISTIVSLLTPEYQQRMVQEAYHQVRGNALWPSTFCWPEGFMRRFYFAAVREHYVVATPDLVQFTMGVARNFINNIHVGRSFNMQDVASGGVPRLGAAVPRWYGETIGFWDRDTLITWTSNVQAWKSHSQFEFSGKIQSIEIYTPIRDAAGAFVGLNHESIFYDPEALLQPIRIVRNLHKSNKFTDANEVPHTFIECVQTIFSVDGHNAPLTPGAVLQYEVPDMYGRPWDAIWRRYFEQGMTGPGLGEDLFNFDEPKK
jgi:hypothetical protein